MVNLTRVATEELLKGRSSYICPSKNRLDHVPASCPGCRYLKSREQVLQQWHASNSRAVDLAEQGVIIRRGE